MNRTPPTLSLRDRFYLGLLRFFARLPLAWLQRLVAGVGYLARFMPGLTPVFVARRNLELCFPEQSETWVHRTAVASLQANAMTFLEFAYRQRDLFLKNPGHRLQECPLESWFVRRGHVYGAVLAAFPLARELHRLMHSIDERTGSRSPEIVDRFQKVMERLLLEMDAHLRAQSSEP